MSGWREPVVGCGLVTQLTIAVVVSAFLPLLLGIWLDRQLNTSPLITLIMMLFGITTGTVVVYRNVASIYKRIGGSKP